MLLLQLHVQFQWFLSCWSRYSALMFWFHSFRFKIYFSLAISVNLARLSLLGERFSLQNCDLFYFIFVSFHFTRFLIYIQAGWIGRGRDGDAGKGVAGRGGRNGQRLEPVRFSTQRVLKLFIYLCFFIWIFYHILCTKYIQRAIHK